MQVAVHHPSIAVLAVAAICVFPVAGSRAASPDAQILIAQAGSTGGSIGKKGKSASGEEAAAPRSQPKATRSETARGADFSGIWAWTTTCSNGKSGAGQFTLHQNASGGLVGSCSSSEFPCSEVSGQAVANSASLRVFWTGVVGSHYTTVNLRLAAGGRNFTGTEQAAYAGTCAFQGRRN